MDSHAAFKNLRASPEFKELRKKFTRLVYPAAKNPEIVTLISGSELELLPNWDTKFYRVIVMLNPLPADVQYWKIILPHRLIKVRVLISMIRYTGKWEQDWIGPEVR